MILFISCKEKIKSVNKILTIAKRSDESVASRNNRSKFKYYWKGKLYQDTYSFDARYSEQYDFFLIYIDKTNPDGWESFSREDHGYSDTSFIPDSLRHKLYFDIADFILLEKIH